MFEKFGSALREKQRLKWEKKRKNGKQSFMLYNGVLKWGGTMFVLTNINSLLLHQRVHWLYVVSMLIASSWPVTSGQGACGVFKKIAFTEKESGRFNQE